MIIAVFDISVAFFQGKVRKVSYVVFKVNICERIGPGFLTICGIPAQEGGMER